jgi:hypothetical protein
MTNVFLYVLVSNSFQDRNFPSVEKIPTSPTKAPQKTSQPKLNGNIFRGLILGSFDPLATSHKYCDQLLTHESWAGNKFSYGTFWLALSRRFLYLHLARM